MSLEDDLNALRQEVVVLRGEVAAIRRQLDAMAGTPKVAEKIPAHDREMLRLFKARVRILAKSQGKNFGDLAEAVGLQYEDYLARIGGTSKVKNNCNVFYKTIHTLVEWGAIDSKVQIEELLGWLDCPELSPSNFETAHKHGKSLAPSKKEAIREALLRNEEVPLTSEYSQADLERYIRDISEAVALRVQLFDQYLKEGLGNARLFNDLADDPEPRMRMTMMRAIATPPNPNREVNVSPEFIKAILQEAGTEVPVTATKAARQLISRGKLPLSFLTYANGHSYWLIMKIAIDYIVYSQDPETLSLLYEFRHTSYHKSQLMIREYIDREYSAGNFSESHYVMAIEILLAMIQAKRATEASRQKNQEILDKLRQMGPQPKSLLGPAEDNQDT